MHDHPALAAACAGAEPVVPLFVVDPWRLPPKVRRGLDYPPPLALPGGPGGAVDG